MITVVDTDGDYPNKYNFYINGILDQKTTGGSGRVSYSFAIGRRFYGADGIFFDGLIDDVQIFNYALTEEQVKLLYNEGAVSFR